MDNCVNSNVNNESKLNAKLEDFYKAYGEAFAWQGLLERLYIQCLPEEKRGIKEMAGNLGITMSEFSLAAISYMCRLLENHIEKIKAEGS
jgi:hypothetical protein